MTDPLKINRQLTSQSRVSEPSASPMVSIILPVYDVERYLEEAIGSVQAQSLRNIEIIAVDDESPDSCAAILERLAAEDPRIQVIRMKKNSGQGFARNAGIDAARGEFIWFLDPDDYMPKSNHLETVYEMAVRNGSDMVRGRKVLERVENEEGIFVKWRQDPSENFLNIAKESTTYAEAPELLHSRHFCNWLYRTEFLKLSNIRFLTPRWEERPFLLRALTTADRISISLSEGFVYRIRPSSTARATKSQLDFDCQIENFSSVIQILREKSAFDRKSPLRHHACFTIAQYLHYIFVGFPYKLIQEGEVSQTLEELVEAVADILESVDVLPGDLDESSTALSKNYIQAGAYGLILAGVLTRKSNFVRIAAGLDQIQQDLFYSTLLLEPLTIEDQALSDALNRYARNEKVAPSEMLDHTSFPRPRVVIHIGSTKTGSTYLQHLMEMARPQLLRRGFWYPEVGLFWQKSRPHKQAGHSGFIQSVMHDDKKLLTYIETGLSLMNGRIHTIILSSEAFFLKEEASGLPDYFSNYHVEMIVYLRRQDDWANSQYVEFVAGGAVNRVSAPIEEWLEEPSTRDWLNYLRMLEKWEKAVGLERMHIRVYEADRLEGRDLITDFATAANLPELSNLSRPGSQRENRTVLGTPHISAVRLFNSRPFPRQEAYLDFIQEISDKVSLWRTVQGFKVSKPNLMSAEQRVQVLKAASTTNKEIAVRYMRQSDGILFDESRMIADPDLDAMYGPEIDIMTEAYIRYGGRAKKVKKDKPKVISQEPTAKIVTKSVEKTVLINYGLFGWRLWALTPLLRRKIAFNGSRELSRKFDSDPVGFLRASEIGNYRKMTQRFYPQGNLYGPGDMLMYWLPVVEKLTRILYGEDTSMSMKADPIRYFRNLPTRRGRLLGRLLFPAGEIITTRNQEEN